VSESLVPLFVVLAKDVGLEAPFVVQDGEIVANPDAGELAQLDEVAFIDHFDFKPSPDQVSLESDAAPEGRILPGTRYIEVNRPSLETC
jgi:hypothetical protein